MSAKTVFLSYVALAGANAQRDGSSTVFGRAIKEPFGTLIVALEDGQNQHARLDGIARQHGWTTDGVLVVVPDELPHIESPGSLARLVASVRAAVSRLDAELGLPLGQVVIDTGKYLVAGADTNSTQSHSLVTNLLAKLTRITEGAYVAVVTHTPLSDDDRPVGSHDQMASRDHGIAVKNQNGTRRVTLAKHKFAMCGPDVIVGTFNVVPVETPYSPRTVPGLVERGSAAAAWTAGETSLRDEALKQLESIEALLLFMEEFADADGWVAQALVQAAQKNGGFGRNKADAALMTMQAIDPTVVEVEEIAAATGTAKKKRWRLRPGLTAEAFGKTAREALSLDVE
jgi:hypothetical protein